MNAKSLLFFVLTILLTDIGFAQGTANLLTTLPDWADEESAYRDPLRGLTIDSGVIEHIENGNYSSARLSSFGGVKGFTNTELHEDTEGDELWTAYHMWKRLEGVHPNNTWKSRVDNLKAFFINDYVDVLTAAGRETDNNYDHLYGWGLCDWYKTEASAEPDGGAAALTAIDSIVAAMIEWHKTFQGQLTPGDSILNNSNSSRRWSRQLRFAVCAAEVSPTNENRGWRDLLIDLVLQTPDIVQEYGMYFYSEGETVKKGFDYAAGERVINTFHMGIFMDAMWHTWRVLFFENDPREPLIRKRIIDMGTYYRDYAPDNDGRVPLLTGLNVNSGERLQTNSQYGNTDVYTISPVNGLIFAYKLTGNSSYMDAGWRLWLRFQESESGREGVIKHYSDSQLSSANGYRLLRHNKGELQYVYALFENGGYPSVILDGDYDTPRPPANLQVD